MTILQRGYKGFSLAEMLLVLLIMSFLSMAIAPFVTKKFKKTTERLPHGRFECFYNLQGRLTQYMVYETGRGIETDRSGLGYCEFEPPSRAAFFLLQGVAGGGGGAYAAQRPDRRTQTASYSSYDDDGYSVSGYYIPCSRLRYSSSYGACSRTINRFTDSTNQANTHQMWEWVNEIWEDPANTPKRGFKLCSGGGAGGMGKGQMVRTEVYQEDEFGNYVVGADGNYIDTCRFPQDATPILPTTGGEDEDPCFDYPVAPGGDGGDGGCIQVTNIALPLESTINRSNMNYYFSSSAYNDGYAAYATFGNVSCHLSQPKKGQNGYIDYSQGGYIRGADGDSSVISIYTDDGAHTCDYTFTSTVAGGAGNDGGIWKNGGVTFSASPGGVNSNSSFTFIGNYYIPIKYEYKEARNYYGIAGGSGEYRMMFFPELKRRIRVVPGRGGNGGTGTASANQGKAGVNTTARFVEANGSLSSLFMNLQGGRAGTFVMSGNYFKLYSQAPVYLHEVNMENSRVGQFSDFVAALSTDEGTSMQSVIPRDKKPGRGGNGGYTILRDTRNGGGRWFDNKRFTNYGGDDLAMPTAAGKEILCHDSPGLLESQRVKVSGTGDNALACPGEPGEDGAVIIIW